MSELPDWIPKDVRDNYLYIVNSATRRIVTYDDLFTKENSILLWKNVRLAYDKPWQFLQDVKEAYLTAKSVTERGKRRAGVVKDYLEIQELSLELSKKIKKIKELDGLQIYENPLIKYKTLEDLKVLYEGNEFLANEGLDDALEHLLYSKQLEYVSHRAGELSKSVPIIHTFANTEYNAFAGELFKHLEGKRKYQYKIINLSVLAIYKVEEFNSSNILAKQGKINK